MAAYVLTSFVSVKGTSEDATADMETRLETVTDTKTIRLAKILQTADKKFACVLIYDT